MGLCLSVSVSATERFIAKCVSEFFKIDEYLAKLPVRAWLSHAPCTPGHLTALWAVTVLAVY